MASNLNYCGLTWGKSLKDLETFQMNIMTEFIEGSGSQRLIKEGYSLFVSSYVKDLWTSSSENFVFLKAKCYPRMRKHAPARDVFCKINRRNSLKIEEGSCSCKAGQGKCIHLMALLHLVNHLILMGNKTIPDDLSCTSVEQQWHKPRGKQIEPVSLTESVFAKPHFHRKRKPLACSFSEKHVVHPTTDQIVALRNSVKEANASAPLAYLLSVQSNADSKGTPYGEFQHGTTLAHQLVTEEKEKELPVLPIKLPVISLRCQGVTFDELYNITLEECYELEKKTRCQNNEQWHEARKIRLTSSDFGSICKRKCITSHYLAELYQGKNIANLKSVRYGRDNERIARELYEEMAKSNGKRIQTFPVGFVVNPGVPFLGCSPDGVVFDEEINSFGLIEIKCPLSKKNVHIDVALQDKAFYLQKDANGLCLKKVSIYYYQVQGQMLVTGLHFCDFIVYNGNEVWVSRVKKDDNFCIEMFGTLNKFFKTYYEQYVKNMLCPPKKPTLLFLSGPQTGTEP